MRLTLALLAATAIGAVVTIAAAASVGPYAANAFSRVVDKTAEDADRGAIILASDDEEKDQQYRKHVRTSDDDEDSEDDDDDNSAGITPNPAPAGTVAPPANGLFGNGPAPRVQVN